MQHYDQERKDRIDEDILVDCYGDDEVNMGWYYYFRDNLTFPISAVAKLRKRSGGIEQMSVELVSIYSDEAEPIKLGFTVDQSEIVNALDPEALISVSTYEANLQVLNDWRYWKELALLENN